MLKIIKVCEYAALFSHGFLPSYNETLFLFSPLKRVGEMWAALFNDVTLRNIIVIVNTIINSFCILREEDFKEQTVHSGRLDWAGQTISVFVSLSIALFFCLRDWCVCVLVMIVSFMQTGCSWHDEACVSVRCGVSMEGAGAMGSLWGRSECAVV